jgi:hypothetical protein
MKLHDVVYAVGRQHNYIKPQMGLVSNIIEMLAFLLWRNPDVSFA